jgi:SAM-dependent methyltransferase
MDTAPFEAFEAAGWEQRAAGYDALAAVTGRVIDALLDAAHVEAGTRLLDVGTGPGHVAGRATERGATALGVDLAPAMIAHARRSWPAVGFEVADAHALPFPDGAFDAVTASFALLHLGRPEVGVGELARVLRPGGRLAVTVWDRPERVAMLGAVLGALEACGVPPPEGIPAGPPFFRFADDAELGGVLAAAGLVDTVVEAVAFTHRVASADEVWSAIVEGTVRTAALVEGHPEGVQRRLREAFGRELERHRRGEALELPVSVKLGSATRPAPWARSGPSRGPRSAGGPVGGEAAQ